MQGAFKIELSGFSYVALRSSKALRCTLTWTFTDETSGALLGASTEGCLVIRNKEGKLNFQTPLTRTLRGDQRRTQTITPDLAQTLAEIVERSRFSSEIGGEKVKEDIANLDPTLKAAKLEAQVGVVAPEEEEEG